VHTQTYAKTCFWYPRTLANDLNYADRTFHPPPPRKGRVRAAAEVECACSALSAYRWSASRRLSDSRGLSEKLHAGSHSTLCGLELNGRTRLREPERTERLVCRDNMFTAPPRHLLCLTAHPQLCIRRFIIRLDKILYTAELACFSLVTSLSHIFLLDSYGHFPATSVSIVMLFVKIVKRYEIKLALRHQSFANAFYNRLDISSPTNWNKKRG